jgi:hypothetical protein
LAGGTRLHIQVFQCVPICVPCAPCCTPPRQRVLGSDAWGAARCANVGSEPRCMRSASAGRACACVHVSAPICKLRGRAALDGPARTCICLRRFANLGPRDAMHALCLGLTGLRVRACVHRRCTCAVCVRAGVM